MSNTIYSDEDCFNCAIRKPDTNKCPERGIPYIKGISCSWHEPEKTKKKQGFSKKPIVFGFKRNLVS